MSFMRSPDKVHEYNVADRVEVYCDHDDKNEERVRGWLKGVVAQVDNKMVAVQFRVNVYLTDGWMVPDHVLWCQQKAKNLRYYKAKRKRRPRTK